MFNRTISLNASLTAQFAKSRFIKPEDETVFVISFEEAEQQIRILLQNSLMILFLDELPIKEDDSLVFLSTSNKTSIHINSLLLATP